MIIKHDRLRYTLDMIEVSYTVLNIASIIVCFPVTQFIYIRICAWNCVVYDQYTTAKDCSYAQRNAECLDLALKRVVQYIGHFH